MKAIVVSDTHEKGERIEDIVKFAQANGISTVFDAGDLHGEINKYKGVNLHAVYWEEATGAMKRRDFINGVLDVGGTMHENGSAFKLDDLLIFMQHNLADNEQEIPDKRLDFANRNLDQLAEQYKDLDLKRFIFFGHTHIPHLTKDGKSVAINPGWVGSDRTFVVLDTDSKTIEYRTFDKVLLTIDNDSDIVHFRNFSDGKCIARLKNGNEVFVDNGERTEEFSKVITASKFGNQYVMMRIENEQGLQQLIGPGLHSRAYKRIERYHEEFDENGNYTGRIAAYEGVKEVNGVEKHFMVIGKDETEGMKFDDINSSVIPIIKEGKSMYYVGKIKTSGNTDTEDETFVHHLVLNNKVVAEYASIDDIVDHDNKLILRAQDEDGKEFVSVIDEDNNISEDSRYNSIGRVEIMDGKRVYTAKDNGKMFIVVDGEEQAKYDSKKLNETLSDAQFMGGKLAYVIEQDSKHRFFYDGNESEEFPAKYWDEGIKKVCDVNGKPGYLVKSSDKNGKIIVDGHVVLDDQIYDFECISGQLIYQREYSESFICQDGTILESYNSLFKIKKDIESGKLVLPVQTQRD